MSQSRFAEFTIETEIWAVNLQFVRLVRFSQPDGQLKATVRFDSSTGVSESVEVTDERDIAELRHRLGLNASHTEQVHGEADGRSIYEEPGNLEL